jgi:hypothetical protein
MDFIWRCAFSRREAGVIRGKIIAWMKYHNCLAGPPITPQGERAATVGLELSPVDTRVKAP